MQLSLPYELFVQALQENTEMGPSADVLFSYFPKLAWVDIVNYSQSGRYLYLRENVVRGELDPKLMSHDEVDLL